MEFDSHDSVLFLKSLGAWWLKEKGFFFCKSLGCSHRDVTDIRSWSGHIIVFVRRR